jgi:hypothetical protein
MSVTLPTLTPVEDGVLLTLYCIALDGRLPRPGDRMLPSIRRLSVSTPGSWLRAQPCPGRGPSSWATASRQDHFASRRDHDDDCAILRSHR